MLTFGSLFAGIGGIDLGLERAGMRCAWQVEIDGAARSVLSRHWPDVPKYSDVRESGFYNLVPVDLICGGFPCQDLSVAGLRAGLSGKRSSLFYEMTRIVYELQPAYLVWENVPGLLSSGAGRDFLAVLAELDRIGYGGGWRTLDAQYFGVAQRRRRIFGVFARRDIGAARCAEILSLGAGMSGHPEPRREARAGAAGTLAAGAHPSGFNGRDAERGNIVTDEPYTLDWMAGSSGDISFRGKARSWIVDKPGCSRALTANRTLAVIEPAGERVRNALACHHGRNSGEDTFLPVLAFTKRARAEGRTLETQENLAYSLTDGSAGGNPHSRKIAGGFGVRRLTPRECERLQGFPDDWTAEQSDSIRYRQLGNAVCVPVAEWIARRIVEQEAHP